MNGYERIKATLEGRTPDTVPVILHNFMPAAEEEGISMKEFRNSPEKMARCFINYTEKYGLDGILTDVDTALLAGACGAGLDLRENEPAVVVETSGKDIDEIISKIDINNFMKNERIQVYLEAIGRIRKYFGDEVFLRGNADQGPYGLAFLLYGMENFLIDLMDEEKVEDLKKLIESCYHVSLSFHREVYRAGAHCTSFGDSAAGPDLVSPAVYKAYAMEPQHRLAEELKKDNIVTICHMCGNTGSILADLVNTGCGGFELDYKTDIKKVKEHIKGKATFFGNLDPSGVICFGNDKMIEDEVKKLLEAYKDGGRFVLSAGCALPRYTPSENIKTLVKTARDFGKY
jgi:MtaA/CmuA family methyltransferase